MIKYFMTIIGLLNYVKRGRSQEDSKKGKGKRIETKAKKHKK